MDSRNSMNSKQDKYNIKKTHYSKAVKNETKSREKLIILSNKQKQDCQLTNRNKLEDNATFQSNERK